MTSHDPEIHAAERPVLGGFEILCKLSSGGMGDVLLARRRGAFGFEKLLALKTIRGELTKRPEIRAMFLDEARLSARLDHPNIAQVYDFGEDDGALYLAMEYVPGVALNKLIHKLGGPVPAPVAARIMAEVARGLHAAHELRGPDGAPLGVVHRDVSPGNLILTFEGRMKILDFGIAFMQGRETPDTMVGELKGKPSYMAPEHLRGESVDRRADVYSACVVLHELLTGRKLFARDTIFTTMRAVELQRPPAPSAIVGPLPEGLDALVLRGLEKNPEDRFPDTRLLAVELDRIAAEAGGDTLEKFVDRVLPNARDRHRGWLQALASGASPAHLPPPLLVQALPRAAESLLADPVTLIPAEADAPNPAPRISRRMKAVGAVASGLLLGLGVAVVERLREAPEPAVIVMAPPTVAGAEGPGLGAAPEPAEGTSEAPNSSRKPSVARTPIRGEAARRRAATSRPEPSEPVAPRPEAPAPEVAPAPTEYGFLTIGAQPYALVRIDGEDAGATPIVKRRLPAGEHEVVLLRPDTGTVRLRRTLAITARQHERLTAP